jgi:hypothetical protein
MPRGRRPRYRKYSRVYRVRITPQAAKAIRTFGGRTLHDFIRNRLGVNGVVTGRLHLYQAVPGSRPGRILRAERRAGVATAVAMRAARPLHPLTREAASLLLAEPGLGRDLNEDVLEREEPLAVGQRLYYLEVPGARPAGGRSSDASVAIDLKANELRLAVYLSEADAQAISARLRRKEPVGASLAAIRRVYRAAVRAAVAGPRGRLRVVREAPDQEEFVGRLVKLAGNPSRLVARAIERWVAQAIARELRARRDAFIAATASDEDGVTLLVAIKDPPGLRQLTPLLRGGMPKPADLAAISRLGALLRGTPAATVEIQAGHRRA